MMVLDILSVILEVAVALLGLFLFFKSKKIYGLLITFSFAVYVFYDSCRFINLLVCPKILSLSFFLASASICWAIMMIYQEK